MLHRVSQVTGTQRVVLTVTPTTVSRASGIAAIPIKHEFIEDTGDDQLLVVHQMNRPHRALTLGYQDNWFWMAFGQHVFLGKSIRHMQGVQLAIADLYPLPITILVREHFELSWASMPQSPPNTMHAINANDVLNNLAAPFGIKQIHTGAHVLTYHDHEIKHRNKSVLAGYVVAFRALMGDDTQKVVSNQ
jgi:hypothetical protein